MNARPAILALDMGVHLGIALGDAGIPSSRSLVLKKPSEAAAVAHAALLVWIEAILVSGAVQAVFKEAPIPLQAFKRLANSALTVRMTYGFHAVVEAACAARNVPCIDVDVEDVRKHFLGRPRFGSRALAKKAVIRQCHLLGYFPSDVLDADRADACAVWDWAVHANAKMQRLLTKERAA